MIKKNFNFKITKIKMNVDKCLAEIINFTPKVFVNLILSNLEVWRFYNNTYPYIDAVMHSKLGEENYENVPAITEFPCKITFKASFVEEYNNLFKDFTKKLSEKKEIFELTKNQKTIMFMSLRVLLCILAYYGYFWSVFLFSLLQFIFLPYSLFISILVGKEIIYYLSSGYYIYLMICFSIKYIIENCLNLTYLNNILNYNIEITNKFIIYVFAADYSVCILNHFYNKYGKSSEIDFRYSIKSFVYGTLNGKTYNFALLFLLKGAKLPIIIWFLDFFFSLGERIKQIYEKNPTRGYSISFYQTHRIGHLPKIYSDSHKFHHFFRNISPFESHLIGVGGPEDWFFFMFDLFFCKYFNTLPSIFCYKQILTNYEFKLSHSKMENGNDYNSAHVAHHLYPTKNYTWSNSVDMLFNTWLKKDKCVDEYFFIRKEIEGENVNIFYDLVENKNKEE